MFMNNCQWKPNGKTLLPKKKARRTRPRSIVNRLLGSVFAKSMEGNIVFRFVQGTCTVLSNFVGEVWNTATSIAPTLGGKTPITDRYGYYGKLENPGCASCNTAGQYIWQWADGWGVWLQDNSVVELGKNENCARRERR